MNDRMMRYKRLPHPVFADTMESGVVSTRQNKYSQAYFTQYGWSRVYPMRVKKHAHETLSIIFKQDGVPPNVVVDDSKYQTLGKFAKKVREADCHLVATEPYSPWMQAAERCIKKTNLVSSRKMLKSGCPNPLWGHCIDLEALISSHTDLDIYGLEGQVPQTVISGQTGDIIILCEFEWFEWVMFVQPKKTCPDDKRFIVILLGPAIDVGTAITYNILSPDSGYVCLSTVRSWTSKEEANPVRMAERVSFMNKLNSCIRHAAKFSDFPFNDLTPQFEYYADGIKDVFEGTPDETKEVPP